MIERIFSSWPYGFSCHVKRFYLAANHNVTRRGIVEIMDAFFKIDMSLGVIWNMVERVSDARDLFSMQIKPVGKKKRVLRPAVQWRKICFGSKSEKVERFTKCISTITRTCRMQARNPFEYLAGLVTVSFAKAFAFLKEPGIPDSLVAG